MDNEDQKQEDRMVVLAAFEGDTSLIDYNKRVMEGEELGLVGPDDVACVSLLPEVSLIVPLRLRAPGEKPIPPPRAELLFLLEGVQIEKQLTMWNRAGQPYNVVVSQTEGGRARVLVEMLCTLENADNTPLAGLCTCDGSEYPCPTCIAEAEISSTGTASRPSGYVGGTDGTEGGYEDPSNDLVDTGGDTHHGVTDIYGS